MQGAGFNVRTRGKDGRQFGFEDCDGRFKGHIDGVVIEGARVVPEGLEVALGGRDVVLQ